MDDSPVACRGVKISMPMCPVFTIKLTHRTDILVLGTRIGWVLRKAFPTSPGTTGEKITPAAAWTWKMNSEKTWEIKEGR